MDLSRYRQLYADYRRLEHSFEETGNAFALERFNELRSMAFSLPVACFPCNASVPLRQMVAHWAIVHNGPLLPLDQFYDAEVAAFVIHNAAQLDIDALYLQYRRMDDHYSYLRTLLTGIPRTLFDSTATFVFARQVFCGLCAESFMFGRADAHLLNHTRPIEGLTEFSEHEIFEEEDSSDEFEAESVENPRQRDTRRDSDERAYAASVDATWLNKMKKLAVNFLAKAWAILKDTSCKMVAKVVISKLYKAAIDRVPVLAPLRDLFG